MHRPTPRVGLGMRLRGVANAAIDISDGLRGDLQHILDRSNVGASLNVDALPAGPMLARREQALRRRFTLSGGDDYPNSASPHRASNTMPSRSPHAKPASP